MITYWLMRDTEPALVGKGLKAARWGGGGVSQHWWGCHRDGACCRISPLCDWWWYRQHPGAPFYSSSHTHSATQDICAVYTTRSLRYSYYYVHQHHLQITAVQYSITGRLPIPLCWSSKLGKTFSKSNDVKHSYHTLADLTSQHHIHLPLYSISLILEATFVAL